MVIYDSADIYVESFNTTRGKINAIENIIQALLLSAVKAATTGNLSQYSLNDGQIIINCTYRSPESITKAITDLEGVKNMYINRLVGRKMRLIDSKNFNNGRTFK